MANLLYRASRECETKLENKSRAMRQAELDTSRARRLFEFNERQERRRIEFEEQEAARATREAKKGFLEAKNELVQVQAECQM